MTEDQLYALISTKNFKARRQSRSKGWHYAETPDMRAAYMDLMKIKLFIIFY
jgi:hypothetical protein